MANCKIIYPSGEASQVTYECALNFEFGHEEGYLETDDNSRGLDGTLNSYVGPRKKTFDLTFTRVATAQKDAWVLAWNVGGPIDLYLDGDSPTPDAVVKIMEPLLPKSEAAFVGAAHTWSFDVRMEEV